MGTGSLCNVYKLPLNERKDSDRRSLVDHCIFKAQLSCLRESGCPISASQETKFDQTTIAPLGKKTKGVLRGCSKCCNMLKPRVGGSLGRPQELGPRPPCSQPGKLALWAASGSVGLRGGRCLSLFHFGPLFFQPQPERCLFLGSPLFGF